MDLFSFDSPFMSFLGKAVEYMLVCLLCLICSIPIVTAGAAITAKYYVGMKLVRGEDTPFFRAYFKSFKDNFKQSTVIWIIEILIGAFLAYDWYMIYEVGGENFNQTLKILLAILTLYLVMAGIAVFALIARFEMRIKEAIKGALGYTYVNIARLLLVLVLTILPTVACFTYVKWLVGVWPVGSAVCLYIISYHFMKSFKKLEDHVLGNDEESEINEESVETVVTEDYSD